MMRQRLVKTITVLGFLFSALMLGTVRASAQQPTPTTSAPTPTPTTTLAFTPDLAVCRRDGFPPNPICGTIAAI